MDDNNNNKDTSRNHFRYPNHNTMSSLQVDVYESSNNNSWEDCDISDDDDDNNDRRNDTPWGRGVSPRYTDSPGVADQLPSVEEVKANAVLDGRNAKPRSRKPWIVGIVIVMAIALLMALRLVQKEKRLRRQQMDTAISSLRGISLPHAFDDANSPQSKALEWILFHDSLMKKNKGGREDWTPAMIQRYIAAVFGMAVVPKSLQSDFHFLSHRHECDWNTEWTLQDNGKKTKMGILCHDDDDDSTIIAEIRMDSVGLTGTLPRELAYLTNLTTLSLNENALVGNIPSLPNVQERVSLSYNNLGGRLDDVIFSKSLQELRLSENSIQGAIPPSLEYLTQLTTLAIDGNQFTGGLVHIMDLYHLQELYLQYNGFRDKLSNGSFQELRHLVVLKANNNRLSGPLPDALWTLTNLETIDFHSNSLDGHVQKIQQGLVVKHLDVAENFLGGGLHINMNLLAQLTHLDVSANRFDTELPSLASLTNLETLLLTDNSLFGPQPIPDWLEEMTNLQQLSLRSTSRTGSIPEWFASKLTNLRVLDLTWNHVSGSIPENLINLSNLQYLLLNRNRLEGTIPQELTAPEHLTELKMFFVDNNRLIGSLDACQVDFLIADCGDPDQGCPDCPTSLTQQVNCPCCTKCCFVGDEYCNADDWLSQILLPQDGKDDDASDR